MTDIAPQLHHGQRLFGPVQSRRFGRSLGIDLLPYKTCSLDCVYCECGSTTKLTANRERFFPIEEVLQELDAYLASSPQLDTLTFSGSGEPTLHRDIGVVIRHLKKHYPAYPVTVLTNGTLLGDPGVAQALLAADVVSPSLDGTTQRSFEAICRPHSDVHVDEVIAGIASFARQFSGHLLLEIFLVPGINDTPEELAALKAAAETIQPFAIQLNHLDRPGVAKDIGKPTPERLDEIREALRPLPVQSVRKRSPAEWDRAADNPLVPEIYDALTSLGSATTRDLSLRLGVNEGDLAKLVRHLASRGDLLESGDESAEHFRRPSISVS